MNSKALVLVAGPVGAAAFGYGDPASFADIDDIIGFNFYVEITRCDCGIVANDLDVIVAALVRQSAAARQCHDQGHVR